MARHTSLCRFVSTSNGSPRRCRVRNFLKFVSDMRNRSAAARLVSFIRPASRAAWTKWRHNRSRRWTSRSAPVLRPPDTFEAGDELPLVGRQPALAPELRTPARAPALALEVGCAGPDRLSLLRGHCGHAELDRIVLRADREQGGCLRPIHTAAADQLPHDGAVAVPQRLAQRRACPRRDGQDNSVKASTTGCSPRAMTTGGFLRGLGSGGRARMGKAAPCLRLSSRRSSDRYRARPRPLRGLVRRSMSRNRSCETCGARAPRGFGSRRKCFTAARSLSAMSAAVLKFFSTAAPASARDVSPRGGTSPASSGVAADLPGASRTGMDTWSTAVAPGSARQRT